MLRCLIISCLFTLSTAVFCQEKSFVPHIFGGLSTSQVDGDSYGGYDKAGLLLGIGVERRITTKWSWNLDLQYAQKGSVKRADTQNGDFTQFKISLGYIEAPIQIHYHWNNFSLFAGISGGSLIHFKEFDSNGERNNPVAFNRFELAGLGGIRYLFGSMFFAEICLGNSLLSVRDINENNRNTHLRSGNFNRWIYTKIAYRFGS
ncbi:MAG: porin family protein [Luteibaculum sp.]